jgi:hypothetical protein
VARDWAGVAPVPRCLRAMAKPASRRNLAPLVGPLLGVALAAGAGPVGAEFAEPPPRSSAYRHESPYQNEPPYQSDERDTRYVESPDSWSRNAQLSTLRFHVGPAVLAEPTSPGLFTALDVGPRSVGGRLSAWWLRAESDQGLSVYTAELWIDFRHRYSLHPVLGAGASFLRGGAVGGDHTAGAGVLRAALEYELPVVDADARLGLNLLLLLPAIGTERTKPWSSAALTVGAGF